MKNYCSNCNFKEDSKQIIDKVKIRCLRTYEWHKGNYSCGYWKPHDSTLTRYEKLKLIKHAGNKSKEHERYLQYITSNGVITILGSIAILFLMLIIIIGAFFLPTILQ